MGQTRRGLEKRSSYLVVWDFLSFPSWARHVLYMLSTETKVLPKIQAGCAVGTALVGGGFKLR